MFNARDAAKCEEKDPSMNMSPRELLMLGAVKCCKSKEPDQTVCKADKCQFGLQKCFALHGDFAAAEKKFTNPKAMEKDKDGKPQGNCGLAIKNKVEGKACCTYGMKALATCLTKEVGDIKLCKGKWNGILHDEKLFDHITTKMGAFGAGGYCAQFNFTTTTHPTTTTAVGKGDDKGKDDDKGTGGDKGFREEVEVVSDASSFFISALATAIATAIV